MARNQIDSDDDVSRACDQISSWANSAQARIDELEKENKELQDRIDAIETTNTELSERIDELDDELKEAYSESSDE